MQLPEPFCAMFFVNIFFEIGIYIYETRIQQVLSSPDSQSSFTPHPVQMTNLAQVTGERLIQTDKAWKEESLQ